jgi:dUTP pyrophosphatase
MEVRVKKLHPSAVIPSYAHDTDAGLDLTAISRKSDTDGNVVYGTGLAFEIPEGYVGLIFPRSSCSRYDLTLSNCVGVIDSGYRGEVTFKFRPAIRDNATPIDVIDSVANGVMRKYNVGDRIGQMIIMPYPHITLVESDELSDTERGKGGYGSTGK